MVPDIDAYAPHIRAVFGQLERQDPRFIPFSLADQHQRGFQPLLIALEHLLQLPDSRFALSEILDLLDVPALRARFGLREGDLPTLHLWLEGAGVRWGLDAEQRSRLDLPEGLTQNTWRFGLRRMLLGYAVGSGAALGDIEPFDEVGGLDAPWSPLVDLLDALDAAQAALAQQPGQRSGAPACRRCWRCSSAPRTSTTNTCWSSWKISVSAGWNCARTSPWMKSCRSPWSARPGWPDWIPGGWPSLFLPGRSISAP